MSRAKKLLTVVYYITQNPQGPVTAVLKTSDGPDAAPWLCRVGLGVKKRNKTSDLFKLEFQMDLDCCRKSTLWFSFFLFIMMEMMVREIITFDNSQNIQVNLRTEYI